MPRAKRPTTSAAADVDHEKQIEIRWVDLDVYGHVNHAVYLTYLEEARDEWLGRTLGDPASVWSYVVARVAIDYRRELKLDDDVVVARCGLARIGNSSITTREAVSTSGGEISAEAEAVLVARDDETGRSRPLTDVERAAFERAL
jgi:acyl-CoA thioester hydrolase